jgi:radical SAM/Cys-rich protein
MSSAPIDFAATLAAHHTAPPTRRRVSTVQINVGKLCNQACHHCHVDAGPKRTERMQAATAARIVELLDRSHGVETVDLTGGAPELNDQFRFLVTAARERGLRVIDRCNLTVLFEPGMERLAEFLAANRVEIVSSLPCYTAENVDKQRGIGVFDRSIAGLRALNRLGYGGRDAELALDLVYNPVADTLPPEQVTLEAKYREELRRLFGIEFRRLLTITNMPIKRFADQLTRWGHYDSYMGLLVNHFNPATVDSLMCRDLVSISWDGSLYDCDFNQMLELPLGARDVPVTVSDIESFDFLTGGAIATGNHCLGCTAGAGSSCGGTLA